MKVIFAGGGTGGHLYPAIAMAREILKRDPASKVLFVGTPEGIESRILYREGLELKTIRVRGLKGKKRMEQARALLSLPRALMESFSILRSFQPDAVVGVGGYASGPLVLAAFLSRRRTALQEQNSIPGITNLYGNISNLKTKFKSVRLKRIQKTQEQRIDVSQFELTCVLFR